MSQLPNFPFKNQLTQGSIKGGLDINDAENCLPTCIAAGLEYLLHKPFDGGKVKDAVYGVNYQGGTSADHYIQYCASLGVKLFARSGNPTYLDQQVHSYLSQEVPVIGTIPSTYAPPADPFDPGSSHCIIFYKDFPGGLVAMNPWRAFAQSYFDSYWESIFCYGQVWVMQLVQKGTSALNIPSGWKLSPDQHTLIAPNGHSVHTGFMNYVLVHDWHPDDYPLEEERGDGHDGTTQLFRSRRLRWNPKQGVFEQFNGDEIESLQKSLVDAQAQEKALTDKITSLEQAPKPEPQPQTIGVSSDVANVLKQVATDIEHILSAIIPSTATTSVPVVQPKVTLPANNQAAAPSNFTASLS